MCLPPRAGSCAPLGCTTTPRRRRWGSAGRRWGSHLWLSQSLSLGRRPVPSEATCTRNGVRPAGSCSGARGSSSRVGAPHRRCWWRTVPHEGPTAGDSRPGGWCACRPPGGGWGSRGDGGGTPQGRGARAPVPQTGLLVGAPGRGTAGSPGITSIAREGDTASDRVGTWSVQPGVEADTWPPGVRGEGVTRWRPGAA